MKDEVDDLSPERWANDQTLCQCQTVVGLPERHPRHDVADRRERKEFCREQQEAWDDR